MSDTITMQEIDAAAACVRGRISIQPQIALILVPGWVPWLTKLKARLSSPPTKFQIGQSQPCRDTKVSC